MASVNGRTVAIKAGVLNDLASRFLLNLSNEEKKDPIKLCSYIELAHWYYLDLMRPEDASLPGCNLKEFMRALFQHCPWLLEDSTKDLEKLIAEWKMHKFKKPVRGAIVLNQDLTKCLLVQGYPSGTSWGFPKGKLEEGEADIDAAVREVYEEIGFDIRHLIQEKQYLDAYVKDSDARMYIIPGVPENTDFQPKTRNEIRNIRWFSIKELPTYKNEKGAQGKSSNNFFMIIPFIGQLRRWLSTYKKAKKTKGISANFKGSKPVQSSYTRTQTEESSHSNAKDVAGGVKRTRTEELPHSNASPHKDMPGVTMTTVSRSNTTPLLPTPPRPARPLSSPSLLPLPNSYQHNMQQVSPLHPDLYQSSPKATGHVHSTPHGSNTLPSPLQHLTSHTSLLPHPSINQTAVYPAHLAYSTTGVWRGQGSVSQQRPAPLLPTPGPQQHIHQHHSTPYQRPITTQGVGGVTLTPSKQWTEFKLDKDAIMNRYHSVSVQLL